MKLFLLPVCLSLILLPCLGETLRVMTWNVLDGLDAPETPSHQGALAICARINADVIALQEVRATDRNTSPSHLENFANSAGFPHVFTPPAGSFDSNNRTIILSKHPFKSTTSITSPANSKDVTRAHAVAEIDLPNTDQDPLIISLHLKCCFEDDDFFRRAVELQRIEAFLTATSKTESCPIIVLGDFNLLGSSMIFSELPAGLPITYSLGPDIQFPVPYSSDPESYFSQIPLTRLSAFQQNSTSPGTFRGGSSILDHILISSALLQTPPDSEVYNASLDATFPGLPKNGSPLNSQTGIDGSDHYPVFADFTVGDLGPTEYSITGIEFPVSETFDDFQGRTTPRTWTSSSDLWQGVDDGNSTTRGLRAYASSAIGVLTNESITLSARFLNSTQETITALEVSYLAQQWQTYTNGAPDRWEASIKIHESVTSIPELTFTATPGSPVETSPRAILENLNIPPDSSFEILFQAIPGSTPPPPSNLAFINEFHYDNAGGDSGEFVEIVLNPGFPDDLSDLSLILYNGFNGTDYGTYPVSAFQSGEITPSGHRFYHQEIPGIQNGAPDGIALVLGTEVIDFISYEGSLTATSGTANGLTSTDIGVSQNNSSTIGRDSLSLTGTGSIPSDFSWTQPKAAFTPGRPNIGQTFTGNLLVPQGISIDNLQVRALLDLDMDGTPDGDLDADNDGQTNLLEFLAGSSPVLASSRFTLSASPDAISFPTIPERRYEIEQSTNLTQWSFHSSWDGDGTIQSVPISGNPEALSFYRVRISRTD